MPRDYATAYSAYGTPPDVWGRGGIGVDYQANRSCSTWAKRARLWGIPMNSVLNRKSAGYTDAPFTVANSNGSCGSKTLTPHSLPNRLLTSAVNTFGQDGTLTAAELRSTRNRRLVTTHSSHIPVTNRHDSGPPASSSGSRHGGQRTGCRSIIQYSGSVPAEAHRRWRSASSDSERDAQDRAVGDLAWRAFQREPLAGQWPRRQRQ